MEIARHREEVLLKPAPHPDRPMALHELANAIHRRVEQYGELKYLDEIIELRCEIVTLCPEPHPDRARFLYNQAASFSFRFEHLNGVADLEAAVPIYREALKLLPASHPRRGMFFSQFADCLINRFQIYHNAADMDEAIQLSRDHLLLSVQYPDRATALYELGKQLWTRMKYFEDPKDVDEAIQFHRDALELAPPPAAKQTTTLENIGHSILQRFQREHVQLSLEGIGPFPPKQVNWLKALMEVLTARFRLRRDPADMEEALRLGHHAWGLCPETFQGQRRVLDELTSSFAARFEYGQHNTSDMDQAVRIHKAALVFSPQRDVNRGFYLNNLAQTLAELFEHSEVLSDLDEAIQVLREALPLFPESHPQRINPLNNLADYVYKRFTRAGSEADFEESIQLLRETISNQPDPYSKRDISLDRLANAIYSRFQRRGDDADLEEATQLHREALALRPPSHFKRTTSCNNLALCLHERKDPRDLDEAVQLLHDTLALSPPGPSHSGVRVDALIGLANALLTRFQNYNPRNDADIEEAVELHRQALALGLPGKFSRAAAMNNLGNALAERYRLHHDERDAKETIAMYRDALTLCPTSHPDKIYYLCNYACALATHGQFSTALPLFREAAMYTSTSPLQRFRVAKNWAWYAHKLHDASALEAYKCSLGLLPQLAALSLNVEARHVLASSQTRNLGADAASCAIELGRLDLVFTFLEAGRAVFWSQSLNLRTPLDELRISNPALSAKLTDLAQKLESSSFHVERRNIYSSDHHKNMATLEAEGVKCRRLNNEWDQTVQVIRATVPGFEDFMQHKGFEKATACRCAWPRRDSHSWRKSCHALILKPRSDGNSKYIKLRMLGPREFVEFLADVLRILVSGRPIHDSEIEGSFAAKMSGRGDADTHRLKGKLVYDEGKSLDERMASLLECLWISVVYPVLQSLNIEKSDNPGRIWWCPTGPFASLPIHAAGIYRRNVCTSDYVISSYTPTLKALLSPPFSPMTSLKATAVIQPTTSLPGYSALPYTTEELQKIQQCIPHQWLTTFGTPHSPVSTEKILPHLHTSSIIHFACHGVQDTHKPLHSALVIGNEKLTVEEIMKYTGVHEDSDPEETEIPKHGPGMGLAFLSACQTAMGDSNAPDEVIHLAATLLFAGFRGVVATIWTIHDPDGPEVAETFYRHLFRHTDPDFVPPDLNDSAEALHLAVKKLRTRVAFMRWVPFVHYGL
ncbi:CHAT domain-containing protein [Roridomyces roridus]|uniref:CHAT domain-containing protein n=1 Tax=Roridomyces roridus TaxID=1738132 RepID=A0AAD7BAL2_9AGAR|nr:CHAT domain-containing protein [Roridomyces roridus]